MDDMLLSERIKRDGITITVQATAPGAVQGQTGYAVTLRFEDREYTLPDPFETPDEPTTLDVLSLLTGHAAIVDQAGGREEWAAEYTTDPDEQAKHFTQRGFETWRGINDGLRSLLGTERHYAYLYETERDD